MNAWTRGVTVLMVAGGCAMGQEQPAAQPEKPKQTRPAPSTDPSLSDPRLGDVVKEQRRPGEPVAPTAPAAPKPGLKDVPSIPGLSLLDYRLPGRRGLPEGTFLSAVPGKVLKAGTGDLIFVPGDEGPGKGIAAMALEPSQRAEQLESAGAGGEGGVTATLTGQVFNYRGRQYLLVTAYAGAAAAPKPEPAPKPGAEETSGDPRVDAIVRDLEEARSEPRALSAIKPLPAAAAGAEAPIPAAEGTLVVNRRGRLVRESGSQGRIAFAIDNDADAPAMPAMVVLPCTVLERMELLAAAKGDELVFRVSGRVTTYAGRNYLLPTLAQVLPPSDVAPMQ